MNNYNDYVEHVVTDMLANCDVYAHAHACACGAHFLSILECIVHAALSDA